MQKALRDHNVGSRTLALRDQARHGLILDHFRAVAKSSDGQAMVFSLPSSSEASIQRLSDFFARPETKQTSQNAGVLEDCAEDLDAAGSVPGSSPVFFTVTKTKPSANHHLYVHPGAGASLKSRHVAVALHSSVPLSAGPTQYSVTCQDVRDNGCSDNLALLSTCAGHPSDLEAGLQAWSIDASLEYSIPGGDSEVKDLLSYMIANNYFVEGGEFYVPHAGWLEVASGLSEQGFLQDNDMGGFALTRPGLAKLTLHWKAKDPRPVCSVREHLAIEDLSAFELLLKLEGEGFTWRPWSAAGKKRQLALPYAPGREKVWYSTHVPPPAAYFQALLCARDIVEAGVHQEIPHARDRGSRRLASSSAQAACFAGCGR